MGVTLPIRPGRLASALAALVAIAATAFAQANPNNENDLPLHNGADIVFLYSDPSVGAPTGTYPPDFVSGDLFWKVYPKEALLSPTGALEISGLQLSVLDTDWTTKPAFYDLMFTRGVPSATSPGTIEPDFADPNAVFLSLGSSGMPDLCLLSPALCAGPCPLWDPTYPSFLLDVQLGSCSGDGIIVQADGSTDLVVTAFLPGGMTFQSGPPGWCGQGDYAILDWHSTDEKQADWLGNGLSAYGGFQIGGPGAQLGPEPKEETWALGLQFCEPMLSVRRVASWPAFVDTPVGLDGVELPIGSGSPFGYVVFDEDGIGDLCFAASSLHPPLAAPGYTLFGAALLLDPTDPVVPLSLKSGTVQLDFQGGIPFDNGMFVSPAPLAIPPSAAGLALWSQGLTLDLATLAGRSTQVTRTRLHP